MKRSFFVRVPGLNTLRWPLGLVVAGIVGSAAAQPSIVSVVPANGASGVSPTAPVVFTFNEPMNPDFTSAEFRDVTNPFGTLPVVPSWSVDARVLTCTPSPAFPGPNKMILWTVSGESAGGEPLDGTDSGFFTTGSGGGTGSGTNRITSFVVGVYHAYAQTNTASPSPDPDFPYSFSALTALASNRTATAISVTPPGGSPMPLSQSPFQSEFYSTFAFRTDLTAFNTEFPGGNYVFDVQAATSNQQVNVSVPAVSAHPNTPRIANFDAAQNVNAAQPFQLTWDAFQGGTAADQIWVEVGGVWRTPDPDEPGALNGTATSVTIPAGALAAGSNYDATISFGRGVYSTNTTMATAGQRASSTSFTLVTSGGTTQAPSIRKAAWVDGKLTFEVEFAPGQPITVLYSPTLPAAQWNTLTTTNHASGLVRVTDPQSSAAAGTSRYYRVQAGE